MKRAELSDLSYQLQDSFILEREDGVAHIKKLVDIDPKEWGERYHMLFKHGRIAVNGTVLVVTKKGNVIVTPKSGRRTCSAPLPVKVETSSGCFTLEYSHELLFFYIRHTSKRTH